MVFLHYMQLGTNQASSFLQSKAVRPILKQQRGEEQSIEVEEEEEVGGGRGKSVVQLLQAPPRHTIAQPHSHLPSTSLEEHLLPSLLHRVRAATERKTA